MGSGAGGALYITDSDGNPNVLGLNRNDEGRWLNAYNGNSDNRWNRENGFVFLAPKVFSFLSCSCRGVLFSSDLPIPSSKHPSYFFHRNG